ncbi:MAG: type IV pilin protein [Candidatus Omnitrophota bacterium]
MPMKKEKGFTLVEIITVLVLIGILVAIAMPIYRNAVIKAREAVLKENLFQIRDAISKFYQDKQKYPSSLEELVEKKYLRKIPIDPITNNSDWELIRFEPEEQEDFDSEIIQSITDVKSLSQDVALDGTKYSEW